jgi:hypothetical protein
MSLCKGFTNIAQLSNSYYVITRPKITTKGQKNEKKDLYGE